jgi:hypothetical protein
VTVGLPLFFPLIILGLLGAVVILSASVVVGLSSRTGRQAIQKVTDPVVIKLTQTSVGQQVRPITLCPPSPWILSGQGRLISNRRFFHFPSPSPDLPPLSCAVQLMYETGPRPSPARVAKTFCPSGMWQKLAFSLLLDAIGSSSYVIPVRQPLHSTNAFP